jgi:hypothetical protein
MSLNSNRAPVSSADLPIPLAAGNDRIRRGAYVHRQGENADDEAKVTEFWRAAGLVVRSLEDPSDRFSSLPDLQLTRKGIPWAYCEVKTIWRHRWTTRIMHEGRSVEESMHVSSLSVEERISGDLVTAFQQLNSTNPHRAMKNVVVLVNRDPEASLPALRRVLASNPKHPGRGIADKRAARMASDIRQFCREVDLCLWSTVRTDGTLVIEAYVLFNTEFEEQLRGIVDLDRVQRLTLDPAA